MCESCLESITRVSEALACPVCGSPDSYKDCEVCWEQQIHFDLCRAVFRFDGAIKDLIHELKYNGLLSPVKWLAEQAVEHIRASGHFDDIDLVIPVPLHKVRIRERGFNPSALIAKVMADMLMLEYQEPVKRRIYTKSQTRLSKEERMKNLHTAFALKPEVELSGRTVLLVDDVFTTGSTINEVSRILRKAKPDRIKVLAISRA
ncbi:MAG: ComF family protein [Candidatus Cloacimonadaceae bacterium]|nr:ComF family protein [Candidatus Cloacimonadaceae bacterium]